MKFNKEDHRIHARINSMLPGNDEKLAMIATLLGMGGAMTEFIHLTTEEKDIPPLIKYAMGMIAGNLLAFMSGQKVADYFQFETKMEMDIGEQREEEIYRKMKHIIKMLYASVIAEEIEKL